MFGSKKVIGLDIGTSFIKMAELDVSGKAATLVSFAMAPTPPGAINSGELANPNAISSSIQALRAELRTKRKSISTGIWGNSVIVKKISIPKMDKKMIAEQIKFEAEQYIPFDINTIHLDYYILPKSSSPETMDLILVAAQTEIVMQYANAIKGGGFELSILDVSAFALANIFEINYGKAKNETIGILNIGSGVTNFVALTDGYVAFARDLQVGGGNYTSEIQKEMGVTQSEAEALKMSAVRKSDAPEQVASTLAAVNDAVAEEIRTGIDFFLSSNIGQTVSRLFITGGGSGVPGLLATVAKSSKIPVDLFNPFAKIKMGNKNFSKAYLNDIAPFASIVMGLGLRAAGDK